MVEIKTEWTADNLKKYAEFVFFRKNKFAKVMLIIFPLVFIALVIGCLAIFFLMKLFFGLIMAAVLVLFSGICFVFLRFAINEFVKNALETNGASDFDSALLSGEAIFICKNGEPVGQLSFERLASIDFDERAGAVYLSTVENAVLILEFKNIIKGSKQELTKAVKDIYDKLPKKA